MVLPKRWVILAWIMAVLLLANSLVVLVNIFRFPTPGIRHIISFLSALGLLSGLAFIIPGVLQLLSPRRS
jgi:hypothetical protein